MASVSLNVGGRSYGGWKTVRVTRALEAISGSFQLGVSERWENQHQPWPITEGDECTVLLGSEKVITGHIDSRELGFTATDHTVAVSGRDRTGDLVDSGVQLKGWEFSNVSVLDVARKLCSPYGVVVSMQGGLTAPVLQKKISFDPGDTVANALESLCRTAGLLPVSDGSGHLVLSRASTARCSSDLVEGKNVLSASSKYDQTNRFHKYLVLGQHQGDDWINGSSAASVRGSATDSNVRSSRTHVIRPEGNVTPALANTRAQWEATTRAARADTVSVTVAGWTQSNYLLWPINKLVHVEAPSIGVSGDLLISQVTYSLDIHSGATTQLELRGPKAFLPAPVIGGENNYWKELIKPV